MTAVAADVHATLELSTCSGSSLRYVNYSKRKLFSKIVFLVIYKKNSKEVSF